MQLPRTEKLRLMEALWVNLSSDVEQLESPDWHETELAETEARLKRGEVELIDWNEAKKRLRGD